jgi:hypothetical protein
MSDKTESLLFADSDGHNKRLSTRYSDRLQYNDPIFAVIFILNICIVCALAFMNGIKAIMFTPSKHITIYLDSSTDVDNSGRLNSSNFVGGIFLVLFLCGALSLCWVYLLTNLSHKIVPFTFGLIFCVASASIPVFLAYGNMFAAISIFLVVLIISYMFIYLRPRMEFAAATLKIACGGIRSYPYTLFYAAVTVFVQIWFCILWTLAAVGVATNEWDSTIRAGGKAFDSSACTTYTYYNVSSRHLLQQFCCSYFIFAVADFTSWAVHLHVYIRGSLYLVLVRYQWCARLQQSVFRAKI